MAENRGGNSSRHNKAKRKARKESMQKLSKDHRDIENKDFFANGRLKSEFILNGGDDVLQQEEEESKHGLHIETKLNNKKERSDGKSIAKQKRKADIDISDSSMIKDDELTGMLNEVASGQIKKVKKIKLKRKANVNTVDSESRNSKSTFKAQGIEDVNATSEGIVNNTIINSSAHPAIDYLVLWKEDRSGWSFKKSRQIWLLKNMYDETKVVSDHFFIHEHLQSIS